MILTIKKRLFGASFFMLYQFGNLLPVLKAELHAAGKDDTGYIPLPTHSHVNFCEKCMLTTY